MQAMKEILTPCSENLFIKIPLELVNKKIEVIILPYIEVRSKSRNERLLKIFKESKGKLPKNYKFDREEAHER